MDSAKSVSIALLGDTSCGKSTFLRRLSHGTQGAGSKTLTTPQALETCHQPFLYDIRLYNRYYRFKFFDSISEDNYRNLQPDLAVFCYDISDSTSLRNARKHWYVLHACTHQQEIPMVLLGLKRDLRDKSLNSVYAGDALAVAQEMRCDRYVECSAATGELFVESFEDIARLGARTTTTAGAFSEPSCTIF